MTVLQENKKLSYAALAFLLIIVAIAAYLQLLMLLFLPLVIVSAICLIQYPHYLFYLLLFSIPWSVEYNFSQSLGTDLPDEPLMLFTSFAVVILLIYKKKSIGEWKLHPLLFILLAQMIWVLFTTVLSTEISLSIKYFLAKCWYILAFTGGVVFFFGDKRIMKNSVLVFTVSMFLSMLVALMRHAQYGFAFDKVNKALEPFYRNHVNYSALLVVIIPVQLAFIRTTVAKNVRFFLTVTLLLTVGAVYLSYSRGAWLALLAGLLTYGFLKRKLILFVFLLASVLCIATVFWLGSNDRYLKLAHDYRTTIFHKDFQEHLVATYQLKDVSTAERYYRWVAGLRMAKDRWQTGFGPTTFYNKYKEYTVPAFKTWVSKNLEHSTVHNYFLLLFIEQGAPGLLLFLILIGSMFWYAQTIYHRTNDRFWKVVVAAVTSILSMICTVNFLSDLIETDKVGSIFYICAGILLIADNKTRISKIE